MWDFPNDRQEEGQLLVSMLFLFSWRWISVCAAVIHCANVAVLGSNVSLPNIADSRDRGSLLANKSLVAESSCPNPAFVARNLNLATKVSSSFFSMRNS